MSDNEPIFDGIKKVEIEKPPFVNPTVEMVALYQDHLRPLRDKIHLVNTLMSKAVDLPRSSQDQAGIDAATTKLSGDNDFQRESVAEAVGLLAGLFQKMDENPYPGDLPKSKTDPRKQAMHLLVTYTDSLVTMKPGVLKDEIVKSSIHTFEEGFTAFLDGRLLAADQRAYLESLSPDEYPLPGSNPPEFGPGSRPYSGSSVTGGGVGLSESLSPYLDRPDMKVHNEAVVYYSKLVMDYFKPQFDSVTHKPGYMN